MLKITKFAISLFFITLLVSACSGLSSASIATSTPASPTNELKQEDWLSMQNPVSGLAWSRDGKILAVSANSGVYIFDSQTQLIIHSLEEGEFLFPLVMDSQGKYLFAGNRVWDIAIGQLLYQLPAANVLAATFSPDTKTLALNDGNNITLWDVLTGKLQKTSIYKFKDAQVVWEGSMTYSAKGNLLYFIDNHKVIQVDLVSGQSTQLFTLPESSCCSVFSRDSKYMVVNLPNHGGGSKQLWDVREGKIIKDTGNCDSDVSFSAISSDSKYFIVGCWFNSQLWNISTQQLTHEFPATTLLSTQPISDPTIPALEWRSAVFSPDNTKIAISNAFGEVLIWDLHNYQLIKSISIPLSHSLGGKG